MAEGLQTTLDLLAETSNRASVRVLMPALDSRYSAIQCGSVDSILRRRSVEGHREVVRRLHRLSAPALEALSRHSARLGSAVRSAILSDDEQLRENGCRAALQFEDFDQVSTLITALEDPASDRELMTKTLIEMMDRLETRSESLEPKSDPQIAMKRTESVLEQSVGRFDVHQQRVVVESFVRLAGRNNATLHLILDDVNHPAFKVLLDVLVNQGSPGTIRLLLSFLEHPRAPSGVLSVLSKRKDTAFLQQLMRKVGHTPAKTMQQNLRRIRSLDWLEALPTSLHEFDDAAQHAAIKLVVATGVSRDKVLTLLGKMLVYGNRGGRRAAAEALEQFNGTEANALAMSAMDDEDPHVQATIMKQLRGRGIPGSLPRLVKMVDSPHVIVREAARHSLPEFAVERFLGAFDLLDEHVRQTTGSLVRQIDTNATSRLREELTSGVRRQRIRALQAIQVMEVADSLVESIVELLKDDDHVIRLEAVTALEDSDSPEIEGPLQEMLVDKSATVRAAAAKSLRARYQRKDQ